VKGWGRGHRQDRQSRRLQGRQTSTRATAKLLGTTGEVIGWEKYSSSISDPPLQALGGRIQKMQGRLSRPHSSSPPIMEEYRKDAWVEIVERCQKTPAWTRFELNFSCPPRFAPSAKMGAAMGQDPDILEEVCGWVMGAANKNPSGQK